MTTEAGTDSLDAAWAEAVAALPERYKLEVHQLSHLRGVSLYGWVKYEPPSRPGNRGPRLPRYVEGYGPLPVDKYPTLTAALRALVREVGPA